MIKTNGNKELIFHAKQVYEARKFVEGTSVTALKTILTYEENLEGIVVNAFIHHNIKSIINSTGLGLKRIAHSKISQKTMEVIKSKRVDNLELINLYPLTIEVFELIKHFPTVEKVCGDASNVAQYSLKKEARELFLSALSLFVGRQILICKHLTARMVSPTVNEATKTFLDNYNTTRDLFTAIHQAANKFKEGGMDVKELKDIITKIAGEKHDELSGRIRNTFAINTPRYFEDIIKQIETSRDEFVDESIDELIGNKFPMFTA